MTSIAVHDPKSGVADAASDAEEAVLSAALIENTALDIASAIIRPRDFGDPRRRRIFDAMLRLRAAGAAIDPITLVEDLERHHQLPAAGGHEYIAAVLYAVPNTDGVESWAKLVVDYAKRRRLKQVGSDLQREVDAGKMEPHAIASAFMALLDAATRTDGTRSGAIQLLSDTDVDALPVSLPLIRDVVFQQTIAALIGAYGTLKTFVMLDMMLCIAAGIAWHGHPVQQGTVIYVFAEGASGISKRVAAWKQAHGITGSLPILFVPMALKVSDPAQVAELLSKIAGKLAGPIVAVVLDTVARTMSGNENDVEDMGRYIDGCDKIRDVLGCTVFLVHHTGWSAERSRGSTSLPGAVHTEIIIERDELTVTLKCTKQKDAPEFDPIRLTAYPIAESLAFRAVAVNTTELSANERTCCRVLSASDGLTSSAWHEASGIPETSFHRARKRLVAIGYAKSHKKTYVATDALRLAEAANCQPAAKQLPSSAAPQLPPTSCVLRHDLAAVPDFLGLTV